MRIGIWILGSMVLLFLILSLLLQFSSIQTKLTSLFAKSLSESIGAPVSIERVNLKFFKTVSLRNIFVGDIDGDTLLHAGTFDASISLFSFWHKKIDVDAIGIDDLTIKATRKPDGSTYNFDALLDYFTGSETKKESVWKMDLNRLKLSDSKIEFKDHYEDFHVTSIIGAFNIYLRDLDLQSKVIKIKQIGLGDSRISAAQGPGKKNQQESVTTLKFPSTGWDITVDQIRLDENYLSYNDINESPTYHFNPFDFELEDLSIFVDDLRWNDTIINADLRKTTFYDKCGLIIDDFSGKIEATDKSIAINDIEFLTPFSHVKNESSFTFNQFSDLSHFADSVFISSIFDRSEMDYRDLNLLVPGFKDIEYLNTDFKEKILASGRLEGYLHDLRFNYFQVNAQNALNVNVSGAIRNLGTDKKVVLDFALNEMATSYEALRKITRGFELPEGLAAWKDFHLSGNLRGNANQLTGQNVKLQTGGVTRFEGDVNLRNLNDWKKATFDIDVKDLRTTASDLQGFVEQDLPPALDSLGQFFYTGRFSGNAQDFLLDGTLNSDAGSMKTDIKVTFNDDFTDGSYSGDLLLDSFDLGKVLARNDLGHLSMDINVFGNGFNEDVLRATVLGEVRDLEYNGYHYKDLLIDGRFDKRQFAGHASIEDPNVDFDFEGVVNWSDSLSRFRFRTNIDTVNLTTLGFVNTQLGLSGRIKSDFRGRSLDDMQGHILGQNLSFSNLEEAYTIDSFQIVSDQISTLDRRISVKSDLANGYVKGQFEIENLIAYLIDYADKFFPVRNRESLANRGQLKDQKFEFDWSMANSDKVLSLIDPKIEKIDSVRVSGELDGANARLALVGVINHIAYNGMAFGPITITSNGDTYSFDNTIAIQDAHFADGIDIPYINLDATMANDSTFIGVLAEDATDSIQEKLNLAALITEHDDAYHMQLNNIMVLNGDDWNIDPNHIITFGPQELIVDDLSIVKDNQKIHIESLSLDADDQYSSAYQFDFNQFQLQEISKLLEVEDAFYDGFVDGSFTLKNTGNRVHYLADLIIKNLSMHNEPIGDLVINSTQRSDNLLDILVQLEGGISGLDFRGTYDRTNSAVNLQGEIDRLPLGRLDPFLRKYIHDSEGEISGIVTISGTSRVPVVDGSFELDRISTFVNYLQARYLLPNEDIVIDQNKLLFDGLVIKDPKGNQASISGSVHFGEISNPKLDLNFTTDRFLALNTSANAKELFYGKLYLKAVADIKGSADHPLLDINATALDSTDFTLQPLLNEAAFQQEDFIIFANPEKYSLDTTISIQDLYQLKNYDMDINANVSLTPEAKLTIVVDPSTGDQLECRGRGELAITLDQEDYVNILGNYLISQGNYSFNFQRVLSRTFDIRPGSHVTFIGDILKSRFDIVAGYPVKTSTYELIKNQSTLSPSEESRSRQLSDILVNLKLTGSLEKPVAKFDINIDESTGGLTSSVSTKLVQLREDESSMNKQVFGLLMFNSFIAEEQTTGGAILADAGQSAILSSVSNLISSQLNRLAKRYIKGVDLDFGVGSYSSNYGDANHLVTELNVGLSKRLLNDRLTLKIGGNVLFDSIDDIEILNSQNSTFSGDFILEYKLSPDGNYHLRFSQNISNEHDIFNQGVNYSETGVSIFFTKSFNSRKYQHQLDDE